MKNPLDTRDIIYILDNRTTIVSEINEEQKEVNNFLKSEFNKILQSSYTEEIQLEYIINCFYLYGWFSALPNR